jgi:TonB-linked SusC/RagA family outer membrane protein
MRKIKLFLSALAVLMTTAAFAQNLTVTGTITDASDGSPIPFASVHVKGTMVGASADVEGKYAIDAKSDATLVFSSVGYHTVEVAVSGQKVVNCVLNVDTETLDNAVVVGYGSAKKLGSLVGSVSTVKSEALKNAPSSSVLDNLQGQVAGLSVMSSGGVAGDNNISMKLHGVGSLGSSSTPLFIIDGIQTTARSIMAMNPNDIQSVTVLKDASATSIYGSRAANGVVYITTKTGSYNAKSTITVRSQAGISTLASLDLYENMMSGDELKDFWVKSGLMTPAQIRATYTDQGFDANTKWYQYMQELNTPQYQNDVTIEGGGSKVAYMVGASQYHQKGSTVGNFYDKYSIRSNIQARPKDWFKFGMNLGVNYDKTQSNGNWGSAGSTANFTSGGLSFLLNPLYPVIDPETGEEYEIKYSNGTYNPHYYMSKMPDLYHRYGFFGAFNFEIEPIKNLKIASRSGIDGSFGINNYVRYPSYVGAVGNGSRFRSHTLQYTASITNTIEYSFDIADEHHFTVLAGQEGVANRYDYFQAYANGGITDDRLTNLQNGTQAKYSVSESASASNFFSLFGHADYSIMDKYIIDATVRNDASSRFGKNNKNATFWSVGAMWKIKNESFLSNVNWINELNLKASYGTQGNASIGDYQHLAVVSSLSSKYAEGSGMAVGQPSNNALTWEQQGLLTVAIDGRLADMVDFGIEYYNRTTTSMLMDVPYSYTTGFPSLTSNVGSLSNSGLDLTLGVDILKTRDYWFRVSTTFNYNRERITELFNGLDRWEIANTGIAYVVGQPISYYAPIYAGVDPEDGRNMWYVPGENIDETTTVETTKDFDEATLTQNTGLRRNAPIIGGFSIGGGWKGLSLQADFSYILGKTLINNDAFFFANPYNFAGMNQHKEVADFWTPENKDAKYPNWAAGEVMQISDTHIYEDASFLRLKSLQVGYDLPRRLLGNQTVINGIKVSFVGRNLFTATKYTGIDPEIDSNLTLGIPGNSKQFLFGLELKF